jgi:hypothetical protein
MATFLFRCPLTGYNVQGFVAEDGDDDADTFHPFSCPACTRTHFVNPKTGKIVGSDVEAGR